MDIKPARLYDFESEEFAGILCGLPEGADSDAVEQALFEKFEISSENFHKLMQHLVPYCMVAKSPVTDTVYQGFAHDGMWHLKQPLPMPASTEAASTAAVPG